MDKENYSWGGIGFLALFFLIIIAFWNRGNGLGFNGNGFFGEGFGFGCVGNGFGFQNYKATCDAEKQEIINTARTQYLVEQQANATQAVVNATANATQTKIDFYAYQGLRDELAKTQQALAEANNKLFVKDQLTPITTAIQDIRCNMLTRPNVTGIGAVCPNQAIVNGLGLTTLNGGCNNSFVG